jgi:acyl-CoA synthetase (AMP-forming)/AMP-acid ligase II
VLSLAALLYGWRLVPLLPMYREAELELMLRECEVRVLFLPVEFRGVCYPDLLDRVRPRPGSLAQVYTVRGTHPRCAPYEDLLSADSPLRKPTPAALDAVRMVLYTSGSTGRPKGVLHTHRSLTSLSDFAAGFWGLDSSDVALVPSPLGHIGGSMYAFDLPWLAGLRAVLMERWDPAAAVDLIEREQVSFCAGATPFLEGLLAAAQASHRRLPSLRRFVCGGASVPPGLVHRATGHFSHCTVSRAYGSTEVPVICPGVRTRADARQGAETDGECAADVRILDEEGRDVPEGVAGEIVARAPRMFVGYLRSEDDEGSRTADGYFRMGDIGRRVEGRFLEITGRKKDIIIRSGENISPLEIENVLAEHPAVLQVAVVGIPDARTGEAAVAFVVPQPGCSFDLQQMRDFLALRGLARPKWPEHLRLLPSLPANSIGKVLKQELRRRALEAAP